MSVALAIAFPPRPQPPVRGRSRQPAPQPDSCARRSTRAAAITVTRRGGRARKRALREGDVHLVIVPGDPPTYRFDPGAREPHRAPGRRRRAEARGRPRRTRGTAREEPVAVAGSRYVDWLIPGHRRHGHHGHRHVGHRLLDRPGADAQAAEAAGRQPDAAAGVPAGADAGAAGVPRARGARAARLRRAGARDADSRLVGGHCGRRPGRARWRSAAIGLLLGSRARTFEAMSGIINL